MLTWPFWVPNRAGIVKKIYRAFDKSQLTFVVVLSTTANQATRRFAREIKKKSIRKNTKNNCACQLKEIKLNKSLLY